MKFKRFSLVIGVAVPPTEVTLKDIARAVGKSVATVSKALRGHEDISPETRAFIAQTAAEMGYTPNITARRLQKKRTDAIGLILPVQSARQADPFFTELLTGIANEVARHNFDLLVSARTPGEDEQAAYRRLAAERRVDGLIVAQPRRNDWRIEFLTANNIPFVVVAHQPVPPHPAVWVNTEAGILQAVIHLVEENRRQIALIAPPADLLFHQTIIRAFGNAIAAQPELSGGIISDLTDMSQKEGYRAAQHLLAETPPDAILACHDLVAMGAMKAAQDQGFEIGDDIAIVGFGDILLAEYSQPPLTTIHRPTDVLGRSACRLLLANINAIEATPSPTQIDPWLVVRQSSNLEFWV